MSPHRSSSRRLMNTRPNHTSKGTALSERMDKLSRIAWRSKKLTHLTVYRWQDLPLRRGQKFKYIIYLLLYGGWQSQVWKSVNCKNCYESDIDMSILEIRHCRAYSWCPSVRSASLPHFQEFFRGERSQALTDKSEILCHCICFPLRRAFSPRSSTYVLSP